MRFLNGLTGACQRSSSSSGIGFTNPTLSEYLKTFGKSHDKFIPEVIKEAGDEVARIFLDAFILTDGHITKGKLWGGYRCNDSKLYFTSSDKLASDLGYLIIKCGKAVSYRKSKEKMVQFPNGKYKSGECWTISELNTTRVMVTPDEHLTQEDYDDDVHCVELEKNHTLFVRRKGRVVVSGNCLCTEVEVLRPRKLATVEKQLDKYSDREDEWGVARENVALFNKPIPDDDNSLLARYNRAIENKDRDDAMRVLRSWNSMGRDEKALAVKMANRLDEIGS